MVELEKIRDPKFFMILKFYDIRQVQLVEMEYPDLWVQITSIFERLSLHFTLLQKNYKDLLDYKLCRRES